MNRTLKAFLSRGIDSNLAKTFIRLGLTLTKLKKLSESELIELNISADIRHKLLNEKRPPIPENVIVKLLYDSRWVCNICRDKKSGIIIHHIKEWSVSKDHSEDNLIILCPNHHSEAHTRKDLVLNYTESRLK